MLACFALLGSHRVRGADFRIEDVKLGADGRPTFRYLGDTNSYYILFRGESIPNISHATAMALGTAGSSTLSDDEPISARARRYYRILRVPIAQPLDSDGDQIDDVYELRHRPDLNPLNAADASLDPDRNGLSFLEEYKGVALALTTIRESSPANGETGVAVTRETIVRFSQALSTNTMLSTTNFFATFGGRRILSRVELSSDRRAATLFYLEPLPASARVRVSFVGQGIQDSLGRFIDPDGDGQPGGTGMIDFDTLSITPVSQTAVIGHVYASTPVSDGKGGTTNRPLQGVTITVDGAEQELRTTTDSAGFFRLQPCPSGRFFVQIDGRTALGSQWPNGAYYPFVGKAWEAQPGQTNTLAGGTGEIFVPLIVPQTLQATSPTKDTVITFPSSVIATNAALAGVSITIPPNDLFDNNGTRGGRVGIAPVPPDRLPEPLPSGLNFPLVITIQTDGPSNFDRPVPVRFPNLPDPVTGQKLPPGAKSALWSFNHDTGRWEIQGPMTVTADGNFVESDAGVGVRQPGWHGVQAGTQTSGGSIFGPPRTSDPCRVDFWEGLGGTISDSWKSALDCGLDLIPGKKEVKAATRCVGEFASVSQKFVQDAKDASDSLKRQPNDAGLNLVKVFAVAAKGTLNSLSAALKCSQDFVAAETVDKVLDCGTAGATALDAALSVRSEIDG